MATQDARTAESIAVARENAERQLCAYVMVEKTPTNADPPLYPLLPPYDFRMKNSGQTPARDVSVVGVTYLGLVREVDGDFNVPPVAADHPPRSTGDIGTRTKTRWEIIASSPYFRCYPSILR